MSGDHERLLAVSERWRHLYEESQTEVERLRAAAADHAMSENYTLEGQRVLQEMAAELERLRVENARHGDDLYKAWGVIANARDWLLPDDAQAQEWVVAASCWRDEIFHPWLDAHPATGDDDE